MISIDEKYSERSRRSHKSSNLGQEIRIAIRPGTDGHE